MTIAEEFIEKVRAALADIQPMSFGSKADAIERIEDALDAYNKALKESDLKLMAKLFPGGVNHYEG